MADAWRAFDRLMHDKKHPIMACTQEWLEARTKAVTSTESAALFGLHPRTTEFELWHRKKDGVIVEVEDNNRMKWGRRFEAPIAEGMAEDLGVEVEPFKEYLTHPEEPRMGSSFDYKMTDKHGNVGLMEVKNVGVDVYRNVWSEEEAPPFIEIQVQHEMEVAGMDFCLIVALVGGNDPKTIWRNRDRAMGLRIRHRIHTFWKSIEANEPPSPVYEKDADFIISMHQSAGVKVMEADEELQAMLVDYDLFLAKAKFYEQEKKEMKARILDKVGDEYNKVIWPEGNMTLSLGMTKDTPPKVITPDMVGQKIGGRKGYRQFRLTVKKEGRND